MQRSRFRRISELFSKAAELDADSRSAFLDDSCGEDHELRQEVESLLNHDGEEGSLKTGVFGFADDEPEPVPDRIGPYEVQEILGKGGMGVVYRARQETPIRREVAVKLLRRGLESELFLSRFESEKQALATMKHPNVASVYDAGVSADGRPYFAMELVLGEPIIEFCNKRNLDLEARIELFTQVCEGVQHAHQKGIIHRDIKPSNLLVTVESGSPTPKIIDFGVAKSIDRALAGGARDTEAWMLLGTPAYMSPEQALMKPGQVDTRSDIYSLGVVLYELLTGSLPIDAETHERASVYEMCRAIREDQPTRPSACVLAAGGEPGGGTTEVARRSRRAKALREDLDWITMKALEKDPARRYTTPRDLAEDLDRHLAFEPVSARPPSAIYRSRKFARKHRTALVVAGVLVMAISTLLALVTVQSVRADRELARAEREARFAADTAEFLIGLFGKSRPFYERGGKQTIRQSLDKAVEKIRRDLAAQPVMQARLLHAVGDAHRREGRRDRARPLLEEARTVLIEQLGEDDPATQLATESLARLYLYTGRAAEAERMLSRILERRRIVYGPDDPRALQSMLGLGVVYRTTGRNAEAVGLLEQAITGLERLGSEHDRTTRVGEGHLASTYMDLGRYEDARDLLVGLVDVLKAKFGKLHAETMIARYNLGCVLANLGEPEEAMVHLEKSIRDGFSYPGSMYQDPHLVTLRNEPWFSGLERRARLNGMNWPRPTAEARVRVATGQLPEAERLLEDLLYSIGLNRVNEKTASAAVPLEIQTGLYLRQGKFNEAESSARAWIDIIERSPYIEDSQLAPPLLYLAQCLLARADAKGALGLIDRSLGITRWPDREAYARAMRFAIDGRQADALEKLRQASELGYDRPDRVRHNVAFESLSSTSEFDAILARMERNRL